MPRPDRRSRLPACKRIFAGAEQLARNFGVGGVERDHLSTSGSRKPKTSVAVSLRVMAFAQATAMVASP
jgi:hypothetical protein